MSSSPEQDKKRKRHASPVDEDDKLEIDVNLPEPPSKKAKRKEKKLSKSSKHKSEEHDHTAQDEEDVKKVEAVSNNNDQKPLTSATSAAPAKRSDYGIWIGNLPFTASKDSLRRFMLNEGGIDGTDITRVHLPTNDKAQNKGFAYIDFTTPAILDIALTLTERVLEGRSVLIKNAKSFEGRPQKSAAEEGAAGNVSKKQPSKRIFVGNLSFDVTKDDISEHFSQAGQIEDVFLATFEDSGKCKGFGWVRFTDIEAAEAAVRGFIFKSNEVETHDDDDDEELIDGDAVKAKDKKQKKPKKWFINRLHGRPLRCEFAEDAQTRYKKRFTKGSGQAAKSQDPSSQDFPIAAADESLEDLARQAAAARTTTKKRDPKMKKLDKDQRQEERRKKHDARTIAPGKALANTQRASGAIVAAKGSKVKFD